MQKGKESRTNINIDRHKLELFLDDFSRYNAEDAAKKLKELMGHKTDVKHEGSEFIGVSKRKRNKFVFIRKKESGVTNFFVYGGEHRVDFIFENKQTEHEFDKRYLDMKGYKFIKIGKKGRKYYVP